MFFLTMMPPHNNHAVKILLNKVTELLQRKMALTGNVVEQSNANTDVTLGVIFDLICPWLIECDRFVPAHEDLNEMHGIGLGLCGVLYLYNVTVPALDQSHQVVFINEQPISQMNLRDLQFFMGNLQLQFMSLYTKQDSKMHSSVDVACIVLHVMQRIGYWICHTFEINTADDHLKQLASVNGNYLEVRFEEVESLIDVVHTMLGTHRLLVNAKFIDAEHDIVLFQHHREASRETWWEISIVTDCPIGSIIQYKNKFRSLFHSVSQVVYYHYPNYSRQRQLPLNEIQSSITQPTNEAAEDLAKATKHILDCQINILPLLLQVEPNATILYEHTGAGHRPTTAKNAWNWVILGRFVLLD